MYHLRIITSHETIYRLFLLNNKGRFSLLEKYIRFGYIKPFRCCQQQEKAGVDFSAGHKKTTKTVCFSGFKSTPVGIRTPNLLIRSQMLYPIELRALVILACFGQF
jgi:hypothetical protein